ncbi:MAG TPA: ATP-binding protein, partial [Anaerolineae bacterium]|nr:ATP-binding protein [Anaerolineae bacterium]
LVSLVDIAQASVHGAQIIAQQNDIRLDLVVPDVLPPVMGDRGLLGEVFDNLISNAIKFSPHEGTVTIQLEQQDDAIVIQVSDEGPGIPEEELERIWMRSYRVEDDSRPCVGGVGLGLAIVKQIVEAHGGQVGVQSKPGKGTTFTFSIPIAREQTN